MQAHSTDPVARSRPPAYGEDRNDVTDNCKHRGFLIPPSWGCVATVAASRTVSKFLQPPSRGLTRRGTRTERRSSHLVLAADRMAVGAIIDEAAHPPWRADRGRGLDPLSSSTSTLVTRAPGGRCRRRPSPTA
jgi:hypothetical protein